MKSIIKYTAITVIMLVAFSLVLHVRTESRLNKILWELRKMQKESYDTAPIIIQKDGQDRLLHVVYKDGNYYSHSITELYDPSKIINNQ